MSSIDQPLKYLFVAEYDDGTLFIQPENDRSKEHVEGAEHNPSSFRDIDQERLVRFGLFPNGTDPNNCVAIVDLRDGHYEIGGVLVHNTDQNYTPTRPQLIYYREVRLETGADDEGAFERQYISRYFLGWKEKGDSKQSVIGIS